jgi:transglutaminase-like putative cysteine protease
MIRTRILHSTVYHYHEPVGFSRHRLVVRPREGHDVQLELQHLNIMPEHRIFWRRDLFGNSVAFVDFLKKSDTLEIHNEVIVIRRERTSNRTLSDFAGVPVPPIYSPQELPIAEGYLVPVYPEETRGLKSWLRSLPFARGNQDATALVSALNHWIFDNIQYRRREERGVQSPLETLKLASGSCRDMATLLLETVKAAGVAARFSSGYLDSAASAAGKAATHAWIEVYFPEQGWCGVDPTMDVTTGDKHILVGVSWHPRGIMPVSGAYIGEAEVYEKMEVSVKMEKLSSKAAATLHA